jgi:hypothetical protein
MTYTVEHFESLRQRFPNWTALKEHLESDAGGKLRIVDTPVGSYSVIRYVKGQSATAELEVGLFRSVVWDRETNLPVSVAPVKARVGLPPVGATLSATEDFVDGFMMNAWTDASGNLFIATRTQIGGENAFYSETTFGEMFDEALAATPLGGRAGLAAALGPAAFASFVVQHPEHRVVAKVPSAGLYLIHVGSVTESGAVKISERAVNWPQALGRLQIHSFPVRKFNTEQEIKDLLRRTAVQRGWRWQGLVFKDGAGGRWRVRSPSYEALRALRGAEAAAVDRFLRLRASGKVLEYLKHYGEERQTFWDFEQQLRARTKDVVSAYSDVHKAHAVEFKQLPEEYQPAVFRLHKLFLEQLREKGFKVRLQNAIQVFSEMKDFEQRRLVLAEPYVAAEVIEKPTAEGAGPADEGAGAGSSA